MGKKGVKSVKKRDDDPRSEKGLLNGSVEKVGLKNGRLVNGTALKENGKGLTNGRGIVNGNGLTNGNRRNGDNSLINGNGLINGKSLVNGDVISPRTVTRKGRSRKGLKIAGVAVVLVLLLLVIPIFSMFSTKDTSPVIIDGYFDEWSGKSGASDPTGDTEGEGDIDLNMVRVHRWDQRLAFQIEVKGLILTGDKMKNRMDTIILLLDGDRDPMTGYSIDGIGADWFIEVSGMKGRADTVALHRFDDNRSSHDWNGWVQFSSGNAIAKGSCLEGLVGIDLVQDPVILVYIYGPDGNMDRLDDPISTGPLVTSRLIPHAPLLASTDEEMPLARLVLSSTEDMMIRAVVIGLNATNAEGVSIAVGIRVDNGEGGMNTDDTLLGVKEGDGLGFTVNFQSPVPISADTTRSYWITAQVQEEDCSIGVETALPVLIDTMMPVTTEKMPPVDGWERKVTIGTPETIVIDGAFADWSMFPSIAKVTGDPERDVIGGQDPDIDLLETAEILREEAFYFSTRVQGLNLAGTAIPFEPRSGQAPGPVVEPSDTPSPPAPPPKPRVGTDRTEFFIDTKDGMGYHPSWSPIAARYMIVVEGRQGMVLSATLNKFMGKDEDRWDWEEIGTVEAAAGGPRLEVKIPRDLIEGLTGTYSTFVRTTDWEGTLKDLGGHSIHALLQFAIANFDPLEGLPSLPDGYVVTGPTDYYVVQFDGPITEGLRENVESVGAVTLDYIPSFGMIVHLPRGDPDRIRELTNVRWVGPHQPAFRVDPSLLDRSDELQIMVTLYQGGLEVGLRIEGICTEVNWSSATVFEANIDAEDLPSIAQIPEVKFISPQESRGLHNDVQRGITWADPPVEIFGLTGKGQIIAIADTGLDTGNDADGQPDHPDVSGRVIKWFDVVKELWPAGCPGDCTDDRHAHGTHVAGTAVGGGNASNGEFRGVAPEAEIVFQALNDDLGQLGSFIVYKDLHKLYADAYDEGARVHQNSWGSTINWGNYTPHSEQTDDWTWGNKSMLVVYSAGNDGPGGNTTTPPATAKNTLTVAASENYRPLISGSANDIDTLASFSSRGYTHDDRIKPDITAPGTYILSARSSVGGGGWGSYNYYYQFMGGTSMAAPHVSGAAILVRQYYTDYEDITPSSALMKATLINGADDMGAADIPNVNEGWGRLNLTNSLFPEQPRLMRYVDNNTGLSSTDQAVVHDFTVGEEQLPFKVTLVWTDYPGSSAASQTAPKLVNDLDLEVKAPDGTVYKGNDFSNGWSTTGGDADDRNNVENVYLKTPSAGTYSVKVRPSTISEGPQPFALVISGELVPDLNVTNITTDPLSPGAGEDITLRATIENQGSEDLPPLFRHSLSALAPGVTADLNDVAFSHDGDFGLIVGNNRTVLRFDTATGSISTLNTTTVPWTNFTAVAFNPNGHKGNRKLPEALLVGNNGTIVDYDGTKFYNVTGPAGTDRFHDVAWSDSEDLALIVGENGVVYTFPNEAVVFSDDFESGKDSWTLHANSNWDTTNAQSVSPQNSMHITFGADAGGAKDTMTLKNSQSLTGNNFRSAYLEFQNRYKVQGPGNAPYFAVYVSDDGGVTWDLRRAYLNFYIATYGWDVETYDLHGYVPTNSFKVYYRAVSGAGVADGQEWWLDDIYINKTIYASTSVATLDNKAVLQGVRFQPGTGKAIIVGEGGKAWKFQSGSLSTLASGTSEDLRALSFKAQTEMALVVGHNGTVLDFDGGTNTFTKMPFPDNGSSLWDIEFRQDFNTTGAMPECAQAFIVGGSGDAWQYLSYDDHFESVNSGTAKDLYAVALNNVHWPLYGPGLVVGHGSDPVILKDTPSQSFRPFNVTFYKDNSSYSTKYLGQVVVQGGLAPGTNTTVSFLWEDAPEGTYDITARVDITNNESSSPPVPDRINEVDEWTNNQLSQRLVLVPEFEAVLIPIAGTAVLIMFFRRRFPRDRQRRGRRAPRR